MSMFDMASGVHGTNFSEEALAHKDAKACLLPVGISTSENLVDKFSISRQTQDQMAVESH